MDPLDLRLGDLISTDSALRGNTQCVVAILGVPQHIGVERNGGRPGAAAAPRTIREALYRMATSAIVDVLLDHRLVIIDMGDIETESQTLEEIQDQQCHVIQACMQTGMVPFVLGGGHDVAWPTVNALNSFNVPYGVINIDAHADVRPLKDNLSHSGSPFRQMLEQPNSMLLEGSFTEFGLQPICVAQSHLQYITERGMHYDMLDSIRGAGVAQSWTSALRRASMGSHSGDHGAIHDTGKAQALYVSLDMDCFASAFAPGVSAPSTDGFHPHEIALCMRMAGAEPTLRAVDVVEVNPAFDVDGRTSKLAASMLMHVLSGIADRLR